MALSRTTKLRWFDRGAAAFERTFPGVIASEFGAGAPPLYVCPLCDRTFPREAIDVGLLTAEHVPPVSFGGQELLLTCQRCNNGAGSDVDAHARRKENVLEALSGEVDRAFTVRVRREEQSVNARLITSNKTWTLKVDQHHNRPGAAESFIGSGLAVDTPIHLQFDGDRFAELGAKMSWFRSGFLALFSVYGYRFSFDPALSIVKRQMTTPDTRLIYSFTFEGSRTLLWSERRILDIPEPKCNGVQFGRYVVFYPNPGDLTFYERLEAQIISKRLNPSTSLTAQSYEWPTEPSFGYPIQELTTY